MSRRALRLWSRALATVALLGVAAGCQVDVEVIVSVEPDASGVVEVAVLLDPDAAGRAGDLESDLRVADLEAVGWMVEPVERLVDGGAAMVARKPYGTPDELVAVLAEIGGPDRLFRDVELTRDRPFAEIVLELDGRLDTSGGLEQFGDAELAELLGGFPLGVDPDALAADLGDDPASRVALILEAVMAGSQEPEPARWETTFADAEPVDFATQSSIELEEPRRWLRWALLAAGVAVAGLVIGLIAGRRSRSASSE